MSLRIFTHFLLEGYARQLTLCMLAFWSYEGVVFLVLLPSPHLITSFHLPCLGSTDAYCPRLGDPVPLPPKCRPFHRVRAHSLTGVQNNYSMHARVCEGSLFLYFFIVSIIPEPCASHPLSIFTAWTTGRLQNQHCESCAPLPPFTLINILDAVLLLQSIISSTTVCMNAVLPFQNPYFRLLRPLP